MDGVISHLQPFILPERSSQSSLSDTPPYNCSVISSHPVNTGCQKYLLKVHVFVFVYTLCIRGSGTERAFENRDMSYWTFCSAPHQCCQCSCCLMWKRSWQLEAFFIGRLHTQACLSVHYAARTPEKTCANTQSWTFLSLRSVYPGKVYLSLNISAPFCVHIYTIAYIQHQGRKVSFKGTLHPNRHWSFLLTTEEAGDLL